MRFDLDGDGKLDAIELATMQTTFYRFLQSEEDYADAIFDDADDLTVENDEYSFED